jgi:hypothetical protein
MEMAKRAQEAFNGTGNSTVKFRGDREELVLVNDGAADLMFVAGGIEFTLKPGEVFDEEVNPFNKLEITATGTWRGYVREAY